MPHESPDRRKLVVQTTRAAALVHLDRPRTQRLEALPKYIGLPKWSPDGQRIVGKLSSAIVIHSVATNTTETILNQGERPQWLPDGRNIVFFEPGRVGILNLDTRAETSAPLPALAGVRVDQSGCLSLDGSTLYASETLEQGDIWIIPAAKK
jgi:Tol biopolymer transport system component